MYAHVSDKKARPKICVTHQHPFGHIPSAGLWRLEKIVCLTDREPAASYTPQTFLPSWITRFMAWTAVGKLSRRQVQRQTWRCRARGSSPPRRSARSCKSMKRMRGPLRAQMKRTDSVNEEICTRGSNRCALEARCPNYGECRTELLGTIIATTSECSCKECTQNTVLHGSTTAVTSV